VAIAAGNSAQDQIHASNVVLAGTTEDLGVAVTPVPADPTQQGAWIEIWYDGAVMLPVDVVSPGGRTTCTGVIPAAPCVDDSAEGRT
jgi:hypothetical protein